MKYKQIPKLELFFKEFTHCVEDNPNRANQIVHDVAKFMHIIQIISHSMVMDDLEDIFGELVDEEDIAELIKNSPQGGEA
ncbi:hypothetical protein CMI47_22385 [Candidatus Pacearchaeota archaeon]|nr:hypothetical protein [Candidatus Pacearchaeota archaeon]|tara:strand:+ start:357 stop:596 length:240 start_codon:yes stop_codon:yes gene_type:complete